MPQSLAQVYVHMVFSTKNRRPRLQNDDLRDQLYAYMATILRDNVDSPALIINECHFQKSSVNSVGVMDWNWTNNTRGTSAVPLGLRVDHVRNPGLRQGSQSSPCLRPGLCWGCPFGTSELLRYVVPMIRPIAAPLACRLRRPRRIMLRSVASWRRLPLVSV